MQEFHFWQLWHVYTSACRARRFSFIARGLLHRVVFSQAELTLSALLPGTVLQY